MKFTFDRALVLAIALCYTLGQFVAPQALSALAGVLLVVFAVRLAGGTITWIVTGR